MKVTCVKNDYDEELEVGKEYNARKVIIGGFHTEVLLEEFPDKCFNSLSFDKKFESKLKKAIRFFLESEEDGDYCDTYGIFIKDF